VRFLCSVALVLSFMAASLQGQTTASGTPYEQYLERLTSDIPGKASIHIQQDERMAKFINKHTESMHQKQLRGIPGYRIRIFFDGSQTARKKMNQVKGDFMRVFVNLDVYPDYKAPYWRIYVGDFRTSSEALKEYTRIRKVYPNALLVNDYIKIPEMK
jgi:hypothetical protein